MTGAVEYSKNKIPGSFLSMDWEWKYLGRKENLQEFYFIFYEDYIKESWREYWVPGDIISSSLVFVGAQVTSSGVRQRLLRDQLTSGEECSKLFEPTIDFFFQSLEDTV